MSGEGRAHVDTEEGVVWAETVDELTGNTHPYLNADDCVDGCAEIVKDLVHRLGDMFHCTKLKVFVKVIRLDLEAVDEEG